MQIALTVELSLNKSLVILARCEYFNSDPMGSFNSVAKMADEEKYRVEAPEEEEQKEKKGFFRPLPQVEREFKTALGKHPQPVVKLLGISMFEKNRDLLLIILMPLLTAIIDTAIYSFVTMSIWENSATNLFFIPALAAVPVGLVISETGRALTGGFLSAIFFMILFVLFLMTPALMVPQLGISNFLISGIALTVGYFVFVMVASLLGAVIGTVLREFF
jgi:hypothetical protein